VLTAALVLLLLANLALHVAVERRVARIERLGRDSLVELRTLADASRSKRLSRW
jgi:hypothetical protein